MSQPTPMAVDAASAKRGREDEDDFRDLQDEEASGSAGTPQQQQQQTQQQQPQQPVALTLMDLLQEMKKGQAETREIFGGVKTEMESIKRDVKDTKEMAALATSRVTDVQASVESLEQRVIRLEKGEGVPAKAPRNKGHGKGPHEHKEVEDIEQIGGEQGDTIVVAGFRKLSDRQERQEEWAKTLLQLPEEMKEQIRETIIPGTAGKIILVKITFEPTIRETRDKMFKWARKFRDTKPQIQADDESEPRTFVAYPSKPFAMRQRDGKVTTMLETLKALVADEERPKFRLDMKKGRVIYQRNIFAERTEENDMPKPNMTIIQGIFPHITEEEITAKAAEILAERERTRKEA